MSSPVQDNRLTRSERLRGKSRVDALFTKGEGAFQYPFRYVCLVDRTANRLEPVTSDDGENAGNHVAEMVEQFVADNGVVVLFTAPKRHHKRAIARNTLKRRMREAYRLNKTPLVEKITSCGCELHLALIYTAKEVESYKVIEDALKKIISRLAAKF